MRNTNSKNGQIILVAVLVALGLLSVGCDKNMARPEDLSPFTSISIGDFSASAVKIISGESTTLSWSVEDKDGKVQFVSIDPDVGNVPTSSGSKNVKPKKTTIYHLNVYSNNEIVKSRSVGITVTDDAGNEISEDADLSEPPPVPTVESVCNDSADEDLDGATDCDDSDCGEAANCIEPVYRFADCEESPHVASNSTLVGDEIAITWKNCPFEEITINGLAGMSFLTTDTYKFDAEAAEQVTVMLIGRVGGAAKDNTTLTIDVSEVVKSTFSADVSFTISPSTIFAGQTYQVIWSVNNANSANMDGNTNLQGEENCTVDTCDDTHTLTVTDTNGLTEIFTKKVRVRKFVSQGQVFDKAVTKMVKGKAKGEFYFIAEGNTIYKTGDYLKTVTMVAVGTLANDQILSLAVVDDTTLLAGNRCGAYKISGAQANRILNTECEEDVLAIYVQAQDQYLAGTDESIYKVRPGQGAGSVVPMTSGEFSGAGQSVVHNFLRNPSDKDNIFALTDGGIFKSDDRGGSFEVFELSSESVVTAGYWTKSSPFVWSQNAIYQWNGQNFDEVGISVDGEINFVLKFSGNIYVATAEGVYVRFGNNTIKIDTDHIAEPIRFLLPGGKFMTLQAITASGKKYSISVPLNLQKGTADVTGNSKQ